MIPYFRSLGELIERSWCDRSYSEDIFPELVLDVLRGYPPIENVGAADIIDWTFSSGHEFQQPHMAKLFGEPPVMLFQAPRFYIEALFWYSGTTSIHEHGFSGIFAVLAGSSVHSHWRFARERIVNSRMICGRLERVSTEILRPGDMRPICSGDRLIHQLFHLDLPSVTIVIRTYMDRDSLPQYNYLPPGLAIDPEDDRDGLRRRRLLFLDGMARGHAAGLGAYARKLIESYDLETLYHMFSLLGYRKLDKGLIDELYGIAHERHGGIVTLFRQVCAEERRISKVVALRSRISDHGARFLLALLMLMPDRDAIFDTIRLQFPGAEPLAMVETWLEGMSGKETIGFDFQGVNRLIFLSLVEGEDTEAMFQRLHTQFRGEILDVQSDELLHRASQLAKLTLFHPLLSKSPLLQARART